MATIGLDMLYYAKITEGAGGVETYGEPSVYAKPIDIDLSVEILEAMLYAGDGVADSAREFGGGTMTIGFDDLGATVAADLLGATIDENGVLVHSDEDVSSAVAVGFRAKKANGKYRYFWIYRVKFGVPGTTLATKGDSISFSTPSIEGTIMRRNKADSRGKHPWKAEVTEGDSTVSAATISGWFESVYEPTYSA